MSSVDKQRVHFESVSETYFNARQNSSHLLLKALMWQFFFEKNSTALKPGNKVLEPMCGYSEGKAILENHCHKEFDYTGFDYSENLVEKAKKEFPEAKIFVQDVTQFDADCQYDFMILIGGLHHVFAHVDVSMQKLSSALKPGGYMINFEPTQNNLLLKKIRERIYKKNQLFDDETEEAFDLSHLNKIYHDAGFEIVDQIYPGLMSYVLYYNPDAFPLLNIGGTSMVKTIFGIEKKLFRSWLARKFSFATLSLIRKI